MEIKNSPRSGENSKNAQFQALFEAPTDPVLTSKVQKTVEIDAST